jgi:hypothetical protein
MISIGNPNKVYPPSGAEVARLEAGPVLDKPVGRPFARAGRSHRGACVLLRSGAFGAAMETDWLRLLIAEASHAPPEVTANLLNPRHGCSFTSSADFGMIARDAGAVHSAPTSNMRSLSLVSTGEVPVRVLWVRLVVPAQHAAHDSIFSLVAHDEVGPTSEAPQRAHILRAGEAYNLDVRADVSPSTELGLRTALLVAALQMDSSINLADFTASTHAFVMATRAVGVVASQHEFSALRSDAAPYFPEAVRRIWESPARIIGNPAQPIDPLLPWYSAQVLALHVRRVAALLAPAPAGDPWLADEPPTLAQPQPPPRPSPNHSRWPAPPAPPPPPPPPPPLPLTLAAAAAAGTAAVHDGAGPKAWPDAICADRLRRAAADAPVGARAREARAAVGAAHLAWAQQYGAHFAWLLGEEERQMHAEYARLDMHFAVATRAQPRGGARKNAPVLLKLTVPGAEEKRPALVYGDTVRLRLAALKSHDFIGWVSDALNPHAITICLCPSFGRAYDAARDAAGAQGGAASRGVLVHVRWLLNCQPLCAMYYALDAHLRQVARGDAPCALVTLRASAEAATEGGGGGAATAVGEGEAETEAGETGGQSTSAGASGGWPALELMNRSLNEEQARAVERAVCALADAPSAPPSSPPPARLAQIVWGPPGTGKTSVLVEQVLQVLLRHRDSRAAHGTSARVLVCAPSNGAADVVLSRLVAYASDARFRAAMGWAAADDAEPAASAEGGGALDAEAVARQAARPTGLAAGRWIHRLNSSRRSLASLAASLHRYCAIVDGAFGFLTAAAYRQTPVIVCTCIAALDLVACGAVECAEGVPRGAFTHVLIDEASQGLEPELLIPICLGRPPRDGGCIVVLVGDHRQLGPTVRAPGCRRARHGLNQSMLERLFNCYDADGARGLDPAAPLARVARTLARACTMLRRNYRSHAALLELPSRLFYNEQLVEAASPAMTGALCGWSELPAAGQPLFFYGLVGQQLNEIDSPSFFNPTEAAMLVTLVQKLLRSGLGISTNDVGVITIYRKQVLKLRRLLRDNGLGAVRVGSVDDYQGQEERVVLISTVLSHREAAERVAGGGPTADSLISSAQRFNVAITRAKCLMIVVGNPHALAHDSHWRALLQHALARGCYRGVPFSLDEHEVGGADADAEAFDELDTEVQLSRLAESALGGAGMRARGVLGGGGYGDDELNMSFDLEWRLMI